jgi:hypothetical protein
MTLDINGYQLTNNSGLVFGNSTAKVSTGGFLQSNTTPMMFGARTDTGVVASYPWVVNSTTVNTGAWTSNTTWTCPVAGIYCICITLICGTGAGNQNGYYAVIVNGANTYFGYNAVTDPWDTFTFRVLYKLAVNDTVRWAVNTAPGPVGSAGAYGSNHNMASIWFVG